VTVAFRFTSADLEQMPDIEGVLAAALGGDERQDFGGAD
jgi:hypothetical protein